MEGSVDPVRDIDIINIELALADMAQVCPRTQGAVLLKFSVLVIIAWWADLSCENGCVIFLFFFICKVFPKEGSMTTSGFAGSNWLTVVRTSRSPYFHGMENSCLRMTVYRTFACNAHTYPSSPLLPPPPNPRRLTRIFQQYSYTHTRNRK